MSRAETVSAPRTSKKRRAPHIGPERRRPQILDAALEIAADSGVSAVTMVAIAEHLQVTRPVIYACYQSRTEILAALIAREELYFGEALSGILRDRRVDATASVFVDGFQSLLRAVQARPRAWRLLYGSPGRRRRRPVRPRPQRGRRPLRRAARADLDLLGHSGRGGETPGPRRTLGLVGRKRRPRPPRTGVGRAPLDAGRSGHPVRASGLPGSSRGLTGSGGNAPFFPTPA